MKMAMDELGIAIPDQCRECDVIGSLVAQIEERKGTKSYYEKVSQALLMGENGKALDDAIDDMLPEEIAEEVRRGVRKSAGEEIDSIDASIQDKKDEIRANIISCSGLFKMRAPKDDVTYVVGVCTSQRQYVRDGEPSTIPAQVQVTSRKKTK